MMHSPKEAAGVVNWPTVDLVTYSNGLDKLLRRLSPLLHRIVRDFRIDIQLVGTRTLSLDLQPAAHRRRQYCKCSSNSSGRPRARSSGNTAHFSRFGRSCPRSSRGMPFEVHGSSRPVRRVHCCWLLQRPPRGGVVSYYRTAHRFQSSGNDPSEGDSGDCNTHVPSADLHAAAESFPQHD